MIGDITNMIVNIGFPIACCVGMAFYVKYLNDRNTADVKELRQEQNAALDKVSEAVANNTMALTKLMERMEYWSDSRKEK